ncbi:hypothetical protein PUN28_005453 [Cardiocondyla obscurior]|uniref:Uncharacterized protein n=1 Tax=Cardiocondyla obscurior TaxID=286306 RepID=A0AAW2GHP0_9HYME
MSGSRMRIRAGVCTFYFFTGDLRASDLSRLPAFLLIRDRLIHFISTIFILIFSAFDVHRYRCSIIYRHEMWSIICDMVRVSKRGLIKMWIYVRPLFICYACIHGDIRVSLRTDCRFGSEESF